MKVWVVCLLIIAICIAGYIGLHALAMNDAENNHSAFTEPGVCPTCRTPLVKGVYGYYFPNFIWYCPNCP